ncbi:MAG: ABC transporter permease [Tissierellia bacterium]|nr:ABC transporter permease [Tissierellia bacterium]
MALLLKYIFRSIRENKLRSLLILVSLMISTFILFLNLVSREDILNRYDAMYGMAYGDFDLIIRKIDEEDPFFYQQELNTAGVDVLTRLTAVISIGSYEEETTIPMQFYGCDWGEFEEHGLLSFDTKPEFSPSREDGIILSPYLAELYGLKTGEHVVFNTITGLREYEILAIAEKSGLFYGIDGENRVLMTPSAVQRMMGKDGQISLELLNLNPSGELELGKNILENQNPDFQVQSLIDTDMKDFSVNMISQVLMIILLLAILMNYYVISSNARVLLQARMPVMGTFRSLGASQRRVNGILFLENTIYGCIGGVLGVLLGVFLREPVLSILSQGVSTFKMPTIASSSVPWTYILLSLLFSVSIQLISVLQIIHQMGTTGIKELLFRESSVLQRISLSSTILGVLMLLVSVVIYLNNNHYQVLLSILSLVFGLTGAIIIVPQLVAWGTGFFSRANQRIFGPPSSLGARNIRDSKILHSNIKLVVLSLSIILMIFVTSTSLQGIILQARNAFHSDLVIYGVGKEKSEYDHIKKLSGVERIHFNYSKMQEIKINGNAETLSLLGETEESERTVNIQGDIAKLKSGEAMIDEYYGMRKGYQIGDWIEIESEDFSNRSIRVQLVGTVNASMEVVTRAVIVLSEEQYLEDVSVVPTSIGIDANRNLDDLKKELYNSIPGENVMIQTVTEFFAEQSARVQSILAIVWIFLALSVLLASIGLINNQVIGFIQRKREFAVLNSVAMSRSQLYMMIFFEVADSFLIGCGIGLGLSIWMNLLLERLLASIGLFVAFVFPWNSILVVVAVVFGILILTSLIPIRKISQMNLVHEIKVD